MKNISYWCQKCGFELTTDELNFCPNCGKELTQEKATVKLLGENSSILKPFKLEQNENILALIDNIKSSGLSTKEVGYGIWIIALTNRAAYFFKMNSYYVPTGIFGIAGGAIGGLIGGAISGAVTNAVRYKVNETTTIDFLKEKSKKYFVVNKQSPARVEIKKGGLIILGVVDVKNPTSEKVNLSLPLNKKQQELFSQNYNLIG